MKLYTARYDYNGIGRLDITVKGTDPIGKIFAPTWAMVQGIKNGGLSWEEYKDMYHRLMFRSFGQHREVWEEVMARDDLVVLVCFCPDHTKCHRSLLASIFAWMGHDWLGELKKEV
jgi:hypothetical protein